MPRSSRDEEFSAFVQTRRTGLVRSACHYSEGTVKSQTAKAATRPGDLLSHAAVERTHP